MANRMIDLNATLCHDLFELPIADWVGHIPSDTPEDDSALDLAAFEVDHGYCTGGLFPVSLRALGRHQTLRQNLAEYSHERPLVVRQTPLAGPYKAQVVATLISSYDLKPKALQKRKFN